MAETSGETLGGRYRLLGERASFPFGSWWEAEDDQGARTVVLRLHAEVVDPAARTKEAIAICAKVDTPHLVPWADGGVDAKGHGWLAAPMFGPWSLLEHVTRGDGGLPPIEVAPLLHQLVRAIASGEKAGVLHHALSSELVRLVPLPDGGYGVKVYGYGLADVLPPYKPLLRKQDGYLGVPDYMSPELCGGKASEGSSSDIYALGILMYEAVRGRPPFAPTFASASASATLKRHIFEKPLALHVRYANTPHIKSYEAIAFKALNKTPNRRQATVAELEQELEQLITGEMRVPIVPLSAISGRAPTTSRRLRTQVLPSVTAEAPSVVIADEVAVAAPEPEPEPPAQIAAVSGKGEERSKRSEGTLVFAGLGPAVRELAESARKEERAPAEAVESRDEPVRSTEPATENIASFGSASSDDGSASRDAASGSASRDAASGSASRDVASAGSASRDVASAGSASRDVASAGSASRDVASAGSASRDVASVIFDDADDEDEGSAEEEALPASATTGGKKGKRKKGRKGSHGALATAPTVSVPMVRPVPAPQPRSEAATGETAAPAAHVTPEPKEARVRRKDDTTVRNPGATDAAAVAVQSLSAQPAPKADEQEDWFSEADEGEPKKKGSKAWIFLLLAVAVVVAVVLLLTMDKGEQAKPAEPTGAATGPRYAIKEEPRATPPPAEVKPVAQVEPPAEPVPTAIEPTEVKPPEPEVKPADVAPEVKPAEVKPAAEAKPAEVKPAEPKPAEVKPALEVKPAEVKPAVVKPAEPKPAEVKPVEPKPAEVKPAAVTKPPEVKPAEVKPAEVKPAEVKPAVVTKPAETPTNPGSPEESFKAQAQHYMKLGLESFKAEKFSQAADYFRRAQAADPSNKAAGAYLKRAQEKLAP